MPINPPRRRRFRVAVIEDDYGNLLFAGFTQVRHQFRAKITNLPEYEIARFTRWIQRVHRGHMESYFAMQRDIEEEYRRRIRNERKYIPAPEEL